MPTAAAEQQITKLRSLMDLLTTSVNDLITELSYSPSRKSTAGDRADIRIPRGPKTEEVRKCIIAAAASLEAAVLTPQWRLSYLYTKVMV
ncbi:hypothetical protein CGLO_14931 [Colletotrichum gloeosporioides Cg-14]|uniref:Uncharacterized protein n=1 Tax=Colletotrichum gloeosporioides (strain Cg-14) TaxID=1237896 RepID=T0L351_COLGC|nr:hypothetical protein CGLO_14931 [Colletotrichum gloeosporioides Cg-14]